MRQHSLDILDPDKCRRIDLWLGIHPEQEDEDK